MKNGSTEYENFERMAQKLFKVPHVEIKAKLDAEKAARQQKQRRKTKKPA